MSSFAAVWRASARLLRALTARGRGEKAPLPDARCAPLAAVERALSREAHVLAREPDLDLRLRVNSFVAWNPFRTRE